MRVLVTGHNGYIGSVMVPMLQAAGHTVTGFDTYFYGDCTFGRNTPEIPSLKKDVRNAQLEDLVGFDAIIHLAALSNDPLGNLDSDLTDEINNRASVRLAKLNPNGSRKINLAVSVFNHSLHATFPSRLRHLETIERLAIDQ